MRRLLILVRCVASSAIPQMREELDVCGELRPFGPPKLDRRLHACRIGAHARRALTESSGCSPRCSVGAFAGDNLRFKS